MKLIAESKMSDFRTSYLAAMCYKNGLSNKVRIVYDLEKIINDIWNETDNSLIKDVIVHIYDNGSIYIYPYMNIYSDDSYHKICEWDLTDLHHLVDIFKRYHYYLRYIEWNDGYCLKLKLSEVDPSNDPVSDCVTDIVSRCHEVQELINNMYDDEVIIHESIPESDKQVTNRIIDWIYADKDNLVQLYLDHINNPMYFINTTIHYYDSMDRCFRNYYTWTGHLNELFDDIIKYIDKGYHFELSNQHDYLISEDEVSIDERIKEYRIQKRKEDFIHALEKHEKKLALAERRRQARMERKRMKFREMLIDEMMKKWKLEDEKCETCGGKIYLHGDRGESFRMVKFVTGPYENQVAVYIGNGLEAYKEFHWGEMKNEYYQCWNYDRSGNEYDGTEKAIHFFYNKKLGVFKSNIDYTIEWTGDINTSEVIAGIMEKVEELTESIYTSERTSSFTDALQFLDGCFFDKKMIHEQLNEILKRELIRLPELFRKIVKTDKDHVRMGVTKHWLRDFLRASYVRSITYNFDGKTYTELIRSGRKMFTYSDEFILDDEEIEKIIFAS